MIQVLLPHALSRHAGIDTLLTLELDEPVTPAAILDAIEARHPVLRGMIRDHATHARRPYLRFYACERDLSHEPMDSALPEAVARGEQPFIVLGAISGG